MSIINDLVESLAAQIEELNDSEIDDEDLERVMQRSKTMCAVSGQIIAAGHLALAAERMRAELGPGAPLPKMLEDKGP